MLQQYKNFNAFSIEVSVRCFKCVTAYLSGLIHCISSYEYYSNIQVNNYIDI